MRFKNVLTNIGLLTASIVLAVCGLEIALRFTVYRDEHLYTTRRASRLPKNYFKADSVTGYDIRENAPVARSYVENEFYFDMWSNELGCFDDPFTGEKDHAVLVGDSFSHFGVSLKDQWASVLERMTGGRILKCGISGSGTKQQLYKAERTIAKTGMSPRLIILGYYMNDLENDYKFPERTVINGWLVSEREITDFRTGKMRDRDRHVLAKEVERIEALQVSSATDFKLWIREHSVLYYLVGKMRKALRPAGAQKADVPQLDQPYNCDWAFYPVREYPWLEKAWAAHLGTLRKFKETAGRNKAELLVVLIPSKEQVYQYLMGKTSIDIEQPNKILGDFLRNERIAHIDLLPYFRRYADTREKKLLDPEKDLYWRFDGHWNPRGNALAGLVVSRYVVEHNMFGRTGDREALLKNIDAKLTEFKGAAAQ